MAKCIKPSLYNIDYMRRDTFKDYLFVPNDISQEETEKRLHIKHKNTHFTYFSAKNSLINKENILSRKETKLIKHLEKNSENPYDPNKIESLARKSFCNLKNQINCMLFIIRGKQEFNLNY